MNGIMGCHGNQTIPLNPNAFTYKDILHLSGINQQIDIHIKLSKAWKIGLINPRVLVPGHCLFLYNNDFPSFKVSMNIHECGNEMIFLLDFLMTGLVKFKFFH